MTRNTKLDLLRYYGVWVKQAWMKVGWVFLQNPITGIAWIADKQLPSDGRRCCKIVSNW
jgi:hypothetical protein